MLLMLIGAVWEKGGKCLAELQLEERLQLARSLHMEVLARPVSATDMDTAHSTY